jgi:phloretin hydrolase
MSLGSLSDYLDRPMTPPGRDVLDAIEAGPIDPGQALALKDADRLLDPALLERETGWCVLPDGVAYVAVRTAMPDVSGEMVDWWFDWHPRDPLRYRVWHPKAHRDNSFELAPGAGGREGVDVSRKGVPRARAHARAKAHWGAVHHPVEDVGTGMVHARIEFKPPTDMGMSSDALDDPRIATIVCGYAGDDRLHVRHSPMFHVFLRESQGGKDIDGSEGPENHGGVVLRSRFWLGAALRPYGPLGDIGGPLLNRPGVRRRALPKGLPRALARHCAEEYANLAAILPELYGSFGPSVSGV